MAACTKRLILQSDWDQVLREINGKAWVSVKKTGCPSVYGELKVQELSSDGQPYVLGSENFSIGEITRKTITVSYTEDEVTSLVCKFQAPRLTFSTIHKAKKSVACLDVTPGGLAVSCDTDGKLILWETENGEIRRDLKGHLGDVYSCRFFPSGMVVLSGSADTQLKIWSAETGQCAATCKGHAAGINDTAIVEKGRNFVSCSRDGTAKLWDSGSQACLGTFDECGGVVNGCSIGIPARGFDPGESQQPTDEREVATEGKLLLLACESGVLQGRGLQSRTKVFEARCSDAVNCCTFLNENEAMCGTQDGQIYVWDIRNTSEPLVHRAETRSAILSLLPIHHGVLVGTGDGSCVCFNNNYDPSLELTGPDCDPVYKVVSDGSYLYTACRDSFVRKYTIL
ncbi:proteasomal ATPase-associated factor 1-like [Lineus longissimus]|uniref:proteasomal ATPase-associated factor 1-like n=1 Tax=Lineus longissimus TaxID=88925 RepID=UPI002B4EE0EE